jgi:hypothetical protein
MSEVKIAEDNPAGWEFAMEIASAVSRAVIRVKSGAKDSFWYAGDVGGTEARMIGEDVVPDMVGSGVMNRAPFLLALGRVLHALHGQSICTYRSNGLINHCLQLIDC